MQKLLWRAIYVLAVIIAVSAVQPVFALSPEDEQRKQKVEQLLQQAQVEWEKPIPNTTTQKPTNPKAAVLSKTVAAANEANRISDPRTRVTLLLQTANAQTSYTSIFAYVGKSQFIDEAFRTLARVPSPIQQIQDPLVRANLYQQLSNAWRALGKGALHGTHATNKQACEKERQKYQELADRDRKSAEKVLNQRQTLAGSSLTFKIPAGFMPHGSLQDNPCLLAGPDNTLLLLQHGSGTVELALFADEFMNGIGPAMGVPDLTVFEDKSVQIAPGVPGLMRVATGTMQTTPAIFAFLMFTTDNAHYVIAYVTSATAYSTHLGSFQELLSSVQL
ncbi:MAG: hypothetical protein R6V19_14100 [Armatimonadota bacterium]